jgi:Holliday junction resolvase RusA-like endonuclease
MAYLRFVLPFEPLAAPRPRTRCIARGKGIAYTDPKYRSWLGMVADHLDSLPPFAKFLKPEEVAVHMVLAARRPNTTKLPSPRWDVDNGAKAVLDVLNGRAFEDDQQVAQLTVHKRWTERPDILGSIIVDITSH